MHKSLDHDQEYVRKWRMHPFLSANSRCTDALECGFFFLLVFSQNLQPQICAETHTGDLVKGYFSAKGREDGLTGSGTEMERHTDTVI